MDNSDHLKASIEESFEINNNLAGDDCQPTKSYLAGFIAATFKGKAGRWPSVEEEKDIDAAISKFVKP